MNDRTYLVEKNFSTSSVPHRLTHQMRRNKKWRNTLKRETPLQLLNSPVISSPPAPRLRRAGGGSVLFGTVVEKSPEITPCPLSGDFSTPPRRECTVGVAVEMTEDSFNKRGGSLAKLLPHSLLRRSREYVCAACGARYIANYNR